MAGFVRNKDENNARSSQVSKKTEILIEIRNFLISRYNRFRPALVNIIIIIIISAQGISDTEGEEKNWLENVNAGMTISLGGLPPQNCCGAR